MKSFKSVILKALPLTLLIPSYAAVAIPGKTALDKFCYALTGMNAFKSAEVSATPAVAQGYNHLLGGTHEFKQQEAAQEYNHLLGGTHEFKPHDVLVVPAAPVTEDYSYLLGGPRQPELATQANFTKRALAAVKPATPVVENVTVVTPEVTVEAPVAPAKTRVEQVREMATQVGNYVGTKFNALAERAKSIELPTMKLPRISCSMPAWAKNSVNVLQGYKTVALTYVTAPEHRTQVLVGGVVATAAVTGLAAWYLKKAHHARKAKAIETPVEKLVDAAKTAVALTEKVVTGSQEPVLAPVKPVEQAQAVEVINSDKTEQEKITTLTSLVTLVDVNASVDAEGNKLLHIAAANNNLEVVKFLVAHGAQPFALNTARKSAASVAIKNGFMSIATYLAQAQQEANKKLMESLA